MFPGVQEGQLTAANCSIAVVGVDMPFTILEDDKLEPYIQALKAQENAAPGAEGEAGAAPMEQ